MTGYNLPPGCTVDDIDRAFGSDRSCEVCGLLGGDCICPECPICREVGSPHCYEEHGLKLSDDQRQSKAEAERQADIEAAHVDYALEDEIERRYLQRRWADDAS